MSSRSLSALYLHAWGRVDAGVSGVLAKQPSESTLLSLVMISCFIQMLGHIGAILLYGTAADHFQLILAGIVATLFFLPLMVYAASWGLGHVCRLFKGVGTFYETRVATFWSFALVSPLVALSDVMPPGGFNPSLVSGCALTYVLSASLKHVHQFRSLWRVVICILSLPVIMMVGVWVLNSEM